jgi:LysR family glycine cleavage system transcriptional activator
MPDRLPALRALQVFEAAARCLSYSRAAEELFLTQSAVSHQIKALEAEFGVRLFRRAGRAMLLTSEGQRLHTHIRDGLASFAKGVATLRAGSGPQTLNISATPSLAAGWLVPRLSDFYYRHPDIEVNLRATTAFADFDRDEVDLALRYGPGQWSGMLAEKLFGTEVFPVCSPHYRGGKLPAKPVDLLRGELLHFPGLPSWEEWFKSANMTLEAPLRGPRFSDYALAVQAAERGQGVMLGREAFLAEKLARGQLVRLMRRLPSLRAFDYYIVYPQGIDLPRKSRAFRDWMLEQVRDAAH